MNDLNYRLTHLLFSIAHPEWYESLDYYHPNDDLLSTLRAHIPPTWWLRRTETWFHVTPPNVNLPKQGWKIHVSATPANCQDVLNSVVPVCVRMEAAFKLLLDRRLVRLSTSKGWGREASGKFITVYPTCDDHFKALIEALHQSTQGLAGPYILSDRRYKDSRVVHYRYGGIDGTKILSSHGGQSYMLTSPSGQLYPDLRVPYWSPPPWVADPFQTPEDEDEPVVLRDGRYRIESALATSATGGTYLATDFETGTTVVVKEARPHTGVDDNGIDAVGRLRKEHRLLSKLGDTGVAPKPLDLFVDWEHLFLVEEHLPGLDLAHFTIAYNPILSVHPKEEVLSEHVTTLMKIWHNLALNVAAVHDHNIVCGDLSLGNIMVGDLEFGAVRIVDWEAAWEIDVDLPTDISTPGFTSIGRKVSPGKEDDIYSLGAVMLGTLFPINFLLEVAP